VAVEPHDRPGGVQTGCQCDRLRVRRRAGVCRRTGWRFGGLTGCAPGEHRRGHEAEPGGERNPAHVAPPPPSIPSTRPSRNRRRRVRGGDRLPDVARAAAPSTRGNPARIGDMRHPGRLVTVMATSLARTLGRPAERGPGPGALMLATGLIAIDATILATAVPSIVRDLGGYQQFPWLFSVYLLAQAVSVPIYSRFADTVGRRPVILLGIALFLLGSVLCG